MNVTARLRFPKMPLVTSEIVTDMIVGFSETARLGYKYRLVGVCVCKHGDTVGVVGVRVWGVG